MVITLTWSLGSAGCTSVAVTRAHVQRVTHVDDFQFEGFLWMSRLQDECWKHARNFVKRRCDSAKTLGRRVVIRMLSFPHHTCAHSLSV